MEDLKNDDIDDLKDMTVEELVDLKVRLEEKIDELDDFLENYEAYSNDDIEEE